MELRNIEFIRNIDEVLIDSKKIENIRNNIKLGDLYVLKKFFDKKIIMEIRNYCKNVGRHSIPNYHPIKEGSHNFHRLNKIDERSHVKGCFHQFSFFPWNQDYFDLFNKAKKIYALKNLTSKHEPNAFLNNKPEKGCTARLAVQFYPKGSGFLNKHVDPVDKHQLTVPIMLMSEVGSDFDQGGAFVEKKGQKIILDKEFNIGDVIFFSAEIPHGVLPIDPNTKSSWLNFEGRWMLLFAVNKVSENNDIKDAKDLQ